MQHVLLGIAEHIWAERARTEQDELSALTAELIARAQRAGTMRPEVTQADIAMLMCGLCAAVASDGPGFDWRRRLECRD